MTEPYKDHTGKSYDSIPEMCRAYGIPPSTYAGRIARGWTQEQALTIRPDGNGPKVKPRKNRMVYDHTGQAFLSISDMCNSWNLPEKVYWSRKRILKWPLEKILTEPVRDPKDTANAKPETDHTGQEFMSISEMCRHWGIKLSTYRERRKRGWDIERALTGQEAHVNINSIECVDHKGKRYPSKNAMCRAYGISRYCYESRLDLGWSQAAALSEPMKINARPCRDHKGRLFPASVYMALYLGFPKYAFQGRSGDLAGRIPGFAAKYWAGRKCGRYDIEKCISFPWFLARHSNQRLILDFDAMLAEYHDTDFQPIPASSAKDPYLKILQTMKHPWYLCMLGNEKAVLHYDRLLAIHTESNYGLSRPPGQMQEKNEDREGDQTT